MARKKNTPVNTIGEAEKIEFLVAISEGASTSKAAALIGLSRNVLIRLRATDDRFAEAWDDAFEQANDILEDELMDLALNKHWGPAVIVALKARRPERWATKLVPPQVLVKTESVTVASIAKMEEQHAGGSKIPFARELVIDNEPSPTK